MSNGGIVLGDGEVARAEVMEASRRAATGLASLGVGAGDSVAILLRNDIPFFAVTLATRTLGAYAVPINWHWRSGEIEHVLVDSGAKVLVVHVDLLDEARAVVPDGVTLLVAPTPPGSTRSAAGFTGRVVAVDGAAGHERVTVEVACHTDTGKRALSGTAVGEYPA